MSAAAGTGKAVLDIAKVILDAVNAVRKSAWAREDLEGDLDGIKDRMELVQSRVQPHGRPSTPQGVEALQQLKDTLEAMGVELDALSANAAAIAVTTGQGTGLSTSGSRLVSWVATWAHQQKCSTHCLPTFARYLATCMFSISCCSMSPEQALPHDAQHTTTCCHAQGTCRPDAILRWLAGCCCSNSVDFTNVFVDLLLADD